MTNALHNAIAGMQEALRGSCGDTVTYHRGSASVEVTAVVGQTEFEVDNGYGVVERFESRDFLISAADLVINGEMVLPARGDRIREVVGSTEYVYEVMAPGAEPPWRYSDPHRNMLRIHTKLVAEE